MTLRPATLLAPLAVALVLLAGCGGGGGGSSSGSGSGGGSTSPAAKGTATVSIAWPARSAGRFVPVASNSVVVTLSLKGDPKASQVIGRPSDGSTTSSATFTGLAYGTYAVALEAKPSTDGQGVAQARGAASMTVKEDVPGVASVSLATTVAALAILPAQLDKLGTTTVSVGATDASGATVLLAVGDASEAVSWTADPIVNTLGATVPAVTLSSSTGATVTLTGVHAGATQVHASVGLGLATPLTATGTVTVNAIADGVGTVSVS